MPLTTAPEVYLSGAWRATAFDTSRTAQSVAAGSRKMTVRDVRYWYWTVSLDFETPQVYRLLVAGSAAANPPVGAVVVAAGNHPTLSRVTDTPEVIEEATGVFTVTA